MGLLAAFQCTECTVNTMNTFILPRILALYSQNEHQFYIFDLFVPYVDMYFSIQCSFSMENCAKIVHVFIQNFVVVSLVTRQLMKMIWYPSPSHRDTLNAFRLTVFHEQKALFFGVLGKRFQMISVFIFLF